MAGKAYTVPIKVRIRTEHGHLRATNTPGEYVNIRRQEGYQQNTSELGKQNRFGFGEKCKAVYAWMRAGETNGTAEYYQAKADFYKQLSNPHGCATFRGYLIRNYERYIAGGKF